MSDTSASSGYHASYYEKNKEKLRQKQREYYQRKKNGKNGETPKESPLTLPAANTIFVKTPLPSPPPKESPLAPSFKKPENPADTKLKLFMLAVEIQSTMHRLAELQAEHILLLSTI